MVLRGFDGFGAAEIDHAYAAVLHPEDVAQADVPVQVSVVMDFLQGPQHGLHGLYGIFPRQAAVFPCDILVQRAAVQVFHQDIGGSVQVQLVEYIDDIADLFLGHAGHDPGFLQEAVAEPLEFLLPSGLDLRGHIRPPPAFLREIFLDASGSLQPVVKRDIGNTVSAAADDLPDDKPVPQQITRLQAVRRVCGTWNGGTAVRAMGRTGSQRLHARQAAFSGHISSLHSVHTYTLFLFYLS